MPTREEWANFQAIAGLHIAWRHPRVRPVIMSATSAKLAQQAVDHALALFNLRQLHRQHDAPPTHLPRPGAADNGQGARLPVSWPGAVEADGGGELLFHGRTIADRAAEQTRI